MPIDFFKKEIINILWIHSLKWVKKEKDNPKTSLKKN
jgi:hypothetical protein